MWASHFGKSFISSKPFGRFRKVPNHAVTPKTMPPQPQIPDRPQTPLLYLITSGETTAQTTPQTEDFSNVLRLVEAAMAAKIDLIQIREKHLSANLLYQLSTRATTSTSRSSTRLRRNDPNIIDSQSRSAGD